MRNPCLELPAVEDSFTPPITDWFASSSSSSPHINNDDVGNLSQILSEEQRRLLSAELPRAVRGYGGQKWRRLFSLTTHGASLETLLSRAADVRDTLIVVRDVKGAIFGCFCAEPWKRSRGYSGSGDCWVFTFEPRIRADKLRKRLLRADELRVARKDEEQRRENEAEIAEAARRNSFIESVGAKTLFSIVDPIILSTSSTINGSGVSSSFSQRKESTSISNDNVPPPPLSPSLQRVSMTSSSSSNKFTTSSSISSSSISTTSSSIKLHIYRTANQNKLFQYISLVPSPIQTRVATGLGLGGGSNFALHLDGALDRGCSGPCQTFLSPRLSSSEDEHEGNGDTPEANLLRGGGDTEVESTRSIEADLVLTVGDMGTDGSFRALNVELFTFE